MTRDNATRRIPREAGFCNPLQLPRGPNGRALCRECSTEVPPRSRSFCSSDCVERWKDRTDPAQQRRKVFARDGGRCRECSLDIRALHARTEGLATRIARAAWGSPSKAGPRQRVNAYRRLRRIEPILHRMGFTGVRVKESGHVSSMWDMDHIVPVVEGGGSCGLDNLRTLCRPCHRRATAELARRRAEKRKRAE